MPGSTAEKQRDGLVRESSNPMATRIRAMPHRNATESTGEGHHPRSKLLLSHVRQNSQADSPRGSSRKFLPHRMPPAQREERGHGGRDRESQHSYNVNSYC